MPVLTVPITSANGTETPVVIVEPNIWRTNVALNVALGVFSKSIIGILIRKSIIGIFGTGAGNGEKMSWPSVKCCVTYAIGVETYIHIR